MPILASRAPSPRRFRRGHSRYRGRLFFGPRRVSRLVAGDGNANDIAGTNNGTLQGGATASARGEVGRRSPSMAPMATSRFLTRRRSGRRISRSRPGCCLIRWIQRALVVHRRASNTSSSSRTLASTSFEGFALTKWRVSSADHFDFQVTSGVRSIRRTSPLSERRGHGVVVPRGRRARV